MLIALIFGEARVCLRASPRIMPHLVLADGGGSIEL